MRHEGYNSGEDNAQFTHGHTVGKFSPEYHSWASMIQRCTNENRVAWEYYGGRGIRVCDAWLRSFEVFFADMGPRPLGTSLDRINGDGNYEPNNCRWATKEEQSKNRRAGDKHVRVAATILLAVNSGINTIPAIQILLTNIGMSVHEETTRNIIRTFITEGVMRKEEISVGRSRYSILHPILPEGNTHEFA